LVFESLLIFGDVFGDNLALNMKTKLVSQ
jgi:hypothetical protein